MTTLRKLGSTDIQVAGLGFGCFGLSNAYGPADPEEAVATLHRALDLGCNLLDTADIYGAGSNESLVGRAVRDRRHHAVIATKFGFIVNDAGQVIRRDASPAYVRQAVEASLRRLRVEVIDLYTLHRVDPATPLEETVCAMSQLVAEGKVRAIGLSEVSVAQLRLAHAVHPITSVQSEYSLWFREPELEILPACRELGVSFISFSPLGRGFFAGGFASNKLTENDFRRSLPRFQGQNFARNEAFLRDLDVLAVRKRITSSQLALSWLLQQGDHLLAIPGTRKQEHLEQNNAASNVSWTEMEMQEMDRILESHPISADRYAQGSPFAPQ